MYREIEVGGSVFRLKIDPDTDLTQADLARCAEKLAELFATLPDYEIESIRDALLMLRAVQGIGVRLDDIGAERIFVVAEAARPHCQNVTVEAVDPLLDSDDGRRVR